MSSPSNVVTALSVDRFHQPTSVLLKGDNTFLDLHGAWAGQYRTGPHYINIQYRTPAGVTFTDCKEPYEDNKNLYAMMLPPSCKVISASPQTTFTLGNSNTWAPTDVISYFTLSKQSHVIIMYQYSGFGGDNFVMRLSIDSVPQKHTVSLTGNVYAGNFGLWQGSLQAGKHKASLDYRSRVETIIESHDFMNRALTIITC